MITNQKIKEQAQELQEYTIASRRKIHRYAEISGTEFKTRNYIRGEAEKLGLLVECLDGTGLIVTLDTGRPGKSLVLRADMDALPLAEHENNMAGPRVCVSENPETCHACGHDAHCAMLLTSMKMLSGMREELSGIIYFCFEEGEEDGGGTEIMKSALQQKKIDGAWGIHVYAGLDSGKISVEAGPRMSGGVGVDVIVKGKGGHGSRPDHAINPVFTAAQILPNLACAFENQLDVEKTVTLGITSIQGGQAGNVIPETARILGSFRFFDAEEGKKAEKILKSVCEHTAAMSGCTIEYGKHSSWRLKPVINDQACSSLAEQSLKEILPESAVVQCDRWFASESFSEISHMVPSVFAFLGIRNPEYGSGAPHHNERFDVDEGVLSMGVTATVKYAASFLK